ncbi:unnamed protein product, partial [marine sediment metagenome]
RPKMFNPSTSRVTRWLIILCQLQPPEIPLLNHREAPWGNYQALFSLWSVYHWTNMGMTTWM